MKDIPEDIQNITIDEMNLTVRSYNVLKRAGINNIRDIVGLPGELFVRLRNNSKVSQKNIVNKLIEFGVPYKSIKHLVCAIEEEESKDEIQRNDDKAEQIENLKEKLSLLQRQEKLILFTKKMDENDWPAAIEAFKEAVDLGYKGDYSMIGAMHAIGSDGIDRDLKEAIMWLKWFYADFKAGDLDNDYNVSMFHTCYTLGLCIMWDINESKYSEDTKRRKLDKALDLWRESISYIANLSNDEISRLNREYLKAIGSAFYYGKIQFEGYEDVELGIDYELAYKAYNMAAKLDDYESQIIIADMYEQGKYVKKDMAQATAMYMKSALAGDENAMKWCQEKLIDSLPWNKGNCWQDISIYEALPPKRISPEELLLSQMFGESVLDRDIDEISVDWELKDVVDSLKISTIEDFRCFNMSELSKKDVNFGISFLKVCGAVQRYVYSYLTVFGKYGE